MCVQVKNYNTHWRPYWLHCNLCKLKFDFFAKFETLAEDMKTMKGRHDFSKSMELKNIKLDVAHLGEAGVEFPWANRCIFISLSWSFFKPCSDIQHSQYFSSYNSLMGILLTQYQWVPASITLRGQNTNHRRPIPTQYTASSPSKARLSQLDAALLILCVILFCFQKECQF